MKITKKMVESIIDTLQSWIDAKEEQIDNQNDRDYPNEELIEKYEQQADILNNAMEELSNYLDTFE